MPKQSSDSSASRITDRAPHTAPSDRLTSIVAHAGLVAVSAATGMLHRRFARRRPALAMALVPVAVGGTWLAISRAERRRPFDPAWSEDHDDTRVDAVFLAAGAVPGVIGNIIGGLLGARLPKRVPLDRLPTALAVPIAIAAYDLLHSSLHRLGHEWGPAWMVHSVHHSPRRLYWLNAGRFHVIEVLVDSISESLLSAVLHLAPHQHVTYLTLRGTYGQLQHANIAIDSGPLDRVFSTPDLHRWHHSEIYAEGDNNYGAVTSIWDQLFGTWFRPPRRFDSELGVGRMPDFPDRWVELQRVPIDWPEIKERNAATWLAVR